MSTVDCKITFLASITDPQLEVHVRRSTANQYFNWTELSCHNKCQLSDQPSYIWYNNGQKVGDKEYFHPHPINPADRYFCAVSGYQGFPSPSVCEFTSLSFTKIMLASQEFNSV